MTARARAGTAVDALAHLTGGTQAGRVRWSAFGTAPRDLPDHLRQVPRNPWFISLMRDVYDRPGSDPAELLDRRRFRTADDVRGHPCGALLDACFRALHIRGDRSCGWDPRRSARWIRSLASHLERSGTYDIGLAQLPQAVNRRQRLVPGAVSGTAGGLLTAAALPLVLGLLLCAAAGLSAGPVPARSATGRRPASPAGRTGIPHADQTVFRDPAEGRRSGPVRPAPPVRRAHRDRSTLPPPRFVPPADG
ncbi:hypothetical protein ABTY20_31360 [Streptomyces sp. NPDC126497]|uniref:hypothetical protein n=1 Tax=Streptomyces sp. NPDC126497 TaxID=3155313 RepID=UPI0033276177